MNLSNETLAVMLAETLQIAGNLATAASRAGVLHETEAANIAISMKSLAQILEAYSGDDLPVGLASELQARANGIDYRQKP